MESHLCTYCDSDKLAEIDTYKHTWFVCENCNNAFRQQKDDLFWDNTLTHGLFRNSKLRHVYSHTLLNRQAVEEDRTKAYEYYVKRLQKGFKGTKWETAPQRIVKNSEKHGFDATGKSVLDISGGPGHLSYYLKDRAKRVVCTEFSEQSANAMRETLGIEAATFDYNSQSIHEVVEGPFDLVFINYSIGYCNDLKAFATSLKKLMHKDSLLYIAYSPPTLGLFLRWQMSDYPYTRCWGEETIAKVFAEVGITEIALEKEGQEYYSENQWQYHQTIGNALMGLIRLTANHYKRKALRSNSRFDHDLHQRSIRHMFKVQES